MVMLLMALVKESSVLERLADLVIWRCFSLSRSSLIFFQFRFLELWMLVSMYLF